MVRKGTEKDIAAVAAIYDRIHTAEERGETAIGWVRGDLSHGGHRAGGMESRGTVCDGRRDGHSGGCRADQSGVGFRL